MTRLPSVAEAMVDLVFDPQTSGGLFAAVAPQDAEACVAHAMAVAHEIAANPPLTVQGAKHIMNEATRYETDRLLELVATWNVGHLVTQDLGVAVTAFMTKQPPEYAGR